MTSFQIIMKLCWVFFLFSVIMSQESWFKEKCKDRLAFVHINLSSYYQTETRNVSQFKKKLVGYYTTRSISEFPQICNLNQILEIILRLNHHGPIYCVVICTSTDQAQSDVKYYFVLV